MKGKFYATKIYPYLLMTRLACNQLRAYFLCHNYVPVLYHKSWLYSRQIQHFSKSGLLINPLEAAQNFNIQFIVPLPWNTITTRTRMLALWGYPPPPLPPPLPVTPTHSAPHPTLTPTPIRTPHPTPTPTPIPMITHTIDSYLITSQNKTKSKLQI